MAKRRKRYESGFKARVALEAIRERETIAVEELYLKLHDLVADLEMGLTRYFDFHTYERKHQGLEHRTPWEVFQESLGNSRSTHRRSPRTVSRSR